MFFHIINHYTLEPLSNFLFNFYRSNFYSLKHIQEADLMRDTIKLGVQYHLNRKGYAMVV